MVERAGTHGHDGPAVRHPGLGPITEREAGQGIVGVDALGVDGEHSTTLVPVLSGTRSPLLCSAGPEQRVGCDTAALGGTAVRRLVTSALATLAAGSTLLAGAGCSSDTASRLPES